ncbi:hypothetical protein OHB04_25995 [Streptomyces sp. NBC_01775]|uniref:hypothetical protein n=1 Tax=Streptomyces sp. NBC_01775 TaxID=2975939 RepID=UPI002DD82AC5|nr:hypothetical protein [Streptomyces sp. NBC_01775]WSB78864.1 hypothetical protein OHB04_25995 [Streptomyces sp. NBC_01775]
MPGPPASKFHGWNLRHLPAEPVAGWTPWGESTVPGIRGHVANSGAEPDSAAFIGTALRELLAHG